MGKQSVKIRVALVVDGDGNYNASGWSDGDTNMRDGFEICRDGMPGTHPTEHEYIIKAEVDLPVLPTIKGTATENNKP